ncbi:MAG: hypothetical protein AB1649_26350 [Chloroflexota bacterium]
MTRRVYSFLLALVLSLNWTSVRAQTPPEFHYFSETGHNVSGEFLKFYNSNPNATILYGYPITEEFTSVDGRRVQYFQRARFEYYAEFSDGQRIQVSQLGRNTYVPAAALNVYSPFSCRQYVETGFSVCFAFLEFFDQYGGVAQFGYPISAFEYDDNMIVQYFERARLEWQPWKPEGQRVVISDLGRIYFDQLGEDPGLLAPVTPFDNTQAAVLTLQVRAFVWKAVTLASDSQLIFIIVQDQALQPISNATCTTTVHWPDGRSDSNTIATNTNGVGMVALSFTNQPYGSLISSDVVCNFNGLTGSTTTSFRIWS